MLIDDWMPAWDVHEVHATHVDAGRERVWTALWTADFARSPVVLVLAAVRALPLLFRRGRPPLQPKATLDGFLRAGFVRLDESPGEELVLGLAGRFWRPAAEIVRLTPDEFRTFRRPGNALAVWNFRLEDEDGGVRLTTETRVRCVDEAARRSFLRYWRVVGPFSGLIRVRMLRSIRRTAERGR